ncbi:MAG: hypothetical protein GC181_13130 [Bacteroidetes bacterium]|nr:hypothetical protein [Bacteroidota bacterium]
MSKPLHIENLLLNLNYGERRIVAENVYISFDSVITDSRCPKNVLCVWEGELKASVSLFENSHQHRFIYSSQDPSKVFSAGNYYFSVDSITPYPIHGKEIAKGDYYVHFKIRSENGK